MKGSFGPVTFNSDKGEIRKGFTVKSLEGVTASIAGGAPVKSRITATRVAAVGVFALAARKQEGGESYIHIEGPDFAWTVKAEWKDTEKAHRFVNKLNVAADIAQSSGATSRKDELLALLEQGPMPVREVQERLGISLSELISVQTQCGRAVKASGLGKNRTLELR